MIVQLFNLVVFSILSVAIFLMYRGMTRLNNKVETQKDRQNSLRAEINANKKILRTLYSNFLASGKDNSQ